MTNSQRDLDAQTQLAQTLDQIQASRQAVAQAGQNGATAAANGQSNQPGQGQNPGQGQSPGAGQGQNQGQGQNAGNGGGAQVDTLPPRTSSGQPGRFQGENEVDGVSTLDQQVYVPWERSVNTGEELFIPSQDTGQGEAQLREQRDPLPGAANPALIPYQEAYYNYLDAANQTMERSSIPPSLQDYVRDYFSQLEP